MGGKCSPSLANIYMSSWEQDYIFSDVNPCASHIRWYGRYIDDLLLMWEGSRDDAEKFVDFINENPFNLRFTHVFDVSVTNFLDLTLTGDMEKGITITPYRKPSSTNSTLMADSCHPRHVVKNVPLGELIRRKRHCSGPVTFSEVEKDTRSRLKARKYPIWSLDRASKIVPGIPRKSLMDMPQSHDLTRSQNSSGNVFFSPTFSPQYGEMAQIVKKYLPLLHVDDTLPQILREPVKCVAKQAKTIGNMVSPSLFQDKNQRHNTWMDVKGFFKCGQ